MPSVDASGRNHSPRGPAPQGLYPGVMLESGGSLAVSAGVHSRVSWRPVSSVSFFFALVRDTDKFFTPKKGT